MISEIDLQNLLVCIIFTMVVTPLLIKVAPWFAERTAPVVSRITLVQTGIGESQRV